MRIALTYAALNDLDVTVGDIQNAYLTAPSSEKHYVILDMEFGIENKGKRALIRRALYGGKLAARDYWTHLRSCMEFLGFRSCRADPDVWKREAVKPDGTEYWEYVLLHTDDCLVISHQGDKVIRDEIGKHFKFKEESIGDPDIYLGGKLRKVTLHNGVKAWSFSSAQYVKEAVRNVKDLFVKKGDHEKKEFDSKLWPKTAKAPFENGYRPEIDVSPELPAEKAAYYQSLIGILRWIVELGRVDICTEVSMMASCMALPREEHLKQLFHIFSYLDSHDNGVMVFDPSYKIVEPGTFERQDWLHCGYGTDLTIELPPDMPEKRGLGFVVTAKVDSDHAGDSMTRRSRTGFFVYCNNALVYWMSKKQTAVETSTFGSEFNAMKQCTEYVRGLKYKLRMMGIDCSGPAIIYGDNQSVLANTTVPSSQLKKKSNSVAYHFVREGCASDEWRTGYTSTTDNESDLLSKPLPSGGQREKLVNEVLHHVYDKVNGIGHDCGIVANINVKSPKQKDGLSLAEWITECYDGHWR